MATIFDNIQWKNLKSEFGSLDYPKAVRMEDGSTVVSYVFKDDDGITKVYKQIEVGNSTTYIRSFFDESLTTLTTQSVVEEIIDSNSTTKIEYDNEEAQANNMPNKKTVVSYMEPDKIGSVYTQTDTSYYSNGIEYAKSHEFKIEVPLSHSKKPSRVLSIFPDAENTDIYLVDTTTTYTYIDKSHGEIDEFAIPSANSSKLRHVKYGRTGDKLLPLFEMEYIADTSVFGPTIFSKFSVSHSIDGRSDTGTYEEVTGRVESQTGIFAKMQNDEICNFALETAPIDYHQNSSI